MRNYEEFKHLTYQIDPSNPFSAHYVLKTGESFYIEPVFYNHLTGLKERFPEIFSQLIKEMMAMVERHKKIVFTGNYERPLTEADNYLYFEITDVTNAMRFFYDDKSRGDNYGD
ncbi:MAG: hypothetical protein GX813_00820 [Erysipelotrichia bacterium]|nr:hypothetical protein [Erysipelotrichia bacterium]